MARRRLPRTLPVLLQTAAGDCGVAALGMVLAGFGRPVPPADLRTTLDPGRDGLSALALRRAAERYGLRATAYDLPVLRTDPSRLAALPMPLLAHWEGDHFVVVERVGRRRITVVDPAVGRRRLTPRAAAEGLTGVVLAFRAGTRRVRPPGRRPMVPERARTLLLPVLRRHRPVLAAVLLASALLTLVGLGVPAVTGAVVDGVAGRAPAGRWLPAAAALATAVAVLALARSLAGAALQRQVGLALGHGIGERLFAAPYRYFERRDLGDLVGRVGSTAAVRDLLAGSLVGTLLDAVLTVTYLAVLTALSPALGAVVGGVLAGQLLLVLALSRRARDLHREELLAQARQATLLTDAVSGIASVKASGAEEHVAARWRAAFERAAAVAARRARVSAVVDTLLTTSSTVVPLLLLVVAARVADGSPGRAAGLAALGTATLSPAWGLVGQLLAVSGLGPLLERLADVHEAAGPDAPRRPAATGRLTGAVEVTDLSFSYDRNAPPALAGVGFVAAPGSKTAVVGPSGCGKSTLVKLLAGLHAPTSGRIRFDGHDLAEVDLRDVVGRPGVVLQETFLGTGTVWDALTLARPDASAEEVGRAVWLAALDADLAALPLGYRTRLGDGGQGLSGGQRQRLALARALVARPAVLVLDEATSALDPETEAVVEARLATLGITRIVVAHRLSTVADADHVLVMDRGCVVESGPPRELLAAGGRYAAMVRAGGGSAAAGGVRGLPCPVSAATLVG